VCREKRGHPWTGFSGSGVSDDFGSDVAERTGERGELLVGGMEEFGSVKKMKESRGGKWMETHMPKSTGTMSLSGSLER